MTDLIHRTDDELLSVTEAAAVVRAPVATLRYWRHLGTGPHSFKVGRSVRYWRSDVIHWLEEQRGADGLACRPGSFHAWLVGGGLSGNAL